MSLTLAELNVMITSCRDDDSHVRNPPSVPANFTARAACTVTEGPSNESAVESLPSMTTIFRLYLLLWTCWGQQLALS